jgi:hypothetical protein
MRRGLLPESAYAWLPGVLIAVLGLAASGWLARQQAASAEQVAQARFAQAANALSDALIRRLDAYTEIAFGLRGLFILDPALGRAEFDQAVQNLQVEERLPEVSNIAFTRYLRREDKAAFERAVQADTSLDPRATPASRSARPVIGRSISWRITCGRWRATRGCMGWTSAHSLPTWRRCGIRCAPASRWPARRSTWCSTPWRRPAS